jgi:Tfp pilus assembly protein PilF
MESALALNRGKAEVLSSLGQFYIQQNELSKARSTLEQAVERVPQDPQNHYQLALVYRKLGLAEKAREQMQIFQKLSAREVPQPVGEPMTAPK